MAHEILTHLTAVILSSLREFLILAAAFTVLCRFCSVCNETPMWWRKPDLATDLCWMFLPRLFYGLIQTLMLAFGIIVCYGIVQPAQIADFLAQGHGPLGGRGFWPQVALYLLGNDLIMYFTHRQFHKKRLWRFHSVHHSSTRLEWTSATRFHPVDHILHGMLSDVVMLLLGIPPDVLLWLLPFNVGTSALVHANLDWRFGPFRYVLASPVFHRWHHTSASLGGSSNFAGTFAFIDLLFGTFYMPNDQRPDAYGVGDDRFPAHFAGQLFRPFQPERRSPRPDPDGRSCRLAAPPPEAPASQSGAQG